MGKHAFILPVYYSEFLTWYRFGTKRVLTLELIPVKLDVEQKPIVEEDIAERIAASLPNYEDDFEVLLALVELSQPITLLEMKSGYSTPVFQNVSIRDLLCVYPITGRGRRLLETRLDTDIILGDPLWQDAVLRMDEAHSRELAFTGAEALLTIAGLKSYSEGFTTRDEELSQALRIRESRGKFPVENGTFLTNLLCYDRHELYPKTDIGYFYDLGKIILESRKPEKEGEAYQMLRNLRKALEDKKANRAEDLYTLIDFLSTHLKEIDALIEPYPALSCVVFLKLREELRETDDIDKTSFEALNKHLKDQHSRELALGLWLTGAFFEFPKFAQEYYTAVKAQFLNTTHLSPSLADMKETPSAVMTQASHSDKKGADKENNEEILPATDTSKSLM